MVAAAWWFSFAVSVNSFQVVAVQGMTFSGPSAEWLMRVLTQPAPAAGFDAGMLPAVFAGSLAGALVGGDWKLEGFKDGYSMARYIAGQICGADIAQALQLAIEYERRQSTKTG